MLRLACVLMAVLGAIAGSATVSAARAQGTGPSIEVEPPGGLCFSMQAVHGTGFPPDTPLEILVGSPPGSQLAVDSEFISGHDGTFRQPLADTFRAVCGHVGTSDIYPVPVVEIRVGPGRYADGHRADFDTTTAITTFTKASLTLTPASGPCDTTITVAAHLLPNSSYRLTVGTANELSAYDVPGAVTASDGEFVKTIPASVLQQACASSTDGKVIVSLAWLAPADPGPQISSTFTIGPIAPGGGSGVAVPGARGNLWLTISGGVTIAAAFVLAMATRRIRSQ